MNISLLEEIDNKLFPFSVEFFYTQVGFLFLSLLFLDGQFSALWKRTE